MFDWTSAITLAAKHRLPAVYEWPEQASDGGLMAYGARLDGPYAHVASCVDQPRRGRKPAELPLEQPTSFRLALNRRTASALGLVILPTLLLRADEVIQ